MQDNQSYQPQSSTQQPVMQGQPMQGNTPQPVQVATKTKTSPVVWVLATLLVLTILSFGGYFFYNEFYDKGNSENQDTSADDQSINNQMQELSVEEAKEMISDSINSLYGFETLEYIVTGSDGDEVEYDESYSYDLYRDITQISSRSTCTVCVPTETEETVETKQSESTYSYKIGDEFYLNGDFENAFTEDSYPGEYFGLKFVQESINKYMNDYSYDVEVSSKKDEINGEDVQVVTLKYKNQESSSSVFNMFKAYADVVLDEYEIEATISQEGKLLKITFPYIYDSLSFEFTGFNEELTFDLPDSLLN